jgi:serine/threonine protein kinase
LSTVLGRGGFGEVFTDGEYAYKTPKGISDDAKTQEIAEKYLRNEAKALKDLQHDGVVKLIRFDEDPLQLVLEVMKGKDLFNVLVDGKYIDSMGIMFQIAKVVLFFHNMDYVHCDLSISNVRIIDSQRVKIFDLGCTKKDGSCGTWGRLHGSRCPEHLLGLKVTKSWDVWDMGVILADIELSFEDFNDYEWLRRYRSVLNIDRSDPNDDCCFLRSAIICTITLRTQETFEAVKGYFYEKACDESRGYHQRIWQLTTDILAKNPRNMRSLYPCVNAVLLKRMLQVDPRNRPSVEELLGDPLFTKYKSFA